MNLEKHDFTVGEEVFVPFWIMLDFLDASPPEPFIKCKILRIWTGNFQDANGPVARTACDLDLNKPDLIATGIPIAYLIKQDDLEEWVSKIADWFKNYQCSNTSTNPIGT